MRDHDDRYDFPDQFDLRFRNHALFVHLRATLDFAAEISCEGPQNLSLDDVKLFDDLADQLERAWVEAAKMKKRARGIV